MFILLDSQYEEAHYYQPKVKKHNENEVKHSEFRNNEGRRKLSSAAANPVPSSSLHTVASAITEYALIHYHVMFHAARLLGVAKK